MTAHAKGDAPPAAPRVIKPTGVRTVMLLRLLDEVDGSQRAFVDQLLEADVLGREAQLLGVAESDAGPLAGRDHPVAFRDVEGHRLLDADVLPRLGRLARH